MNFEFEFAIGDLVSASFGSREARGVVVGVRPMGNLVQIAWLKGQTYWVVAAADVIQKIQGVNNESKI